MRVPSRVVAAPARHTDNKRRKERPARRLRNQESGISGGQERLVPLLLPRRERRAPSTARRLPDPWDGQLLLHSGQACRGSQLLFWLWPGQTQEIAFPLHPGQKQLFSVAESFLPDPRASVCQLLQPSERRQHSRFAKYEFERTKAITRISQNFNN